MNSKKRYVQVGLGGRARMFTNAVTETYAHCAEMVGFCDNNEGRARLAATRAKAKGAEVPVYAAEDFDRMVQEQQADCVIVTTKDCWHDHYLCRAMELGCDAITEKPMTTEAEKCQRIIDTQRRTGKKCRVTFNYRYAPPATQVKDLLMSGAIGEVLSVEFHWLLDTSHGADYFRRWHRHKENSGGLMVHKATHHFDLVNWWLSAIPETVFAMGQRKFYTPQTAERYGLKKRAERCRDCPESAQCRFYLDLRAHEGMQQLYLDNEEYDGYFRDRCVFSDLIDIEDTMNVLASYDTGAKMAYSLNAFSPWEGFLVCFNGSKGRLERKEVESSYVSGDGKTPHKVAQDQSYVRVYPHFGEPYTLEEWTGEGGHGGGDPLLLDDIFSPEPQPDKYLRAADHRSGAYSILTGVAANQAMKTGQVVRISDLVQGVDAPDYPAMPTARDSLISA
ncbi:MAG: Gfo/Idh/MocA family oxidoreductase [Armatimonadetes bacterium]|nr:Gfo/Idh/MocA family oxidoreductase [Armatimonadota bacterium]